MTVDTGILKIYKVPTINIIKHLMGASLLGIPLIFMLIHTSNMIIAPIVYYVLYLTVSFFFLKNSSLNLYSNRMEFITPISKITKNHKEIYFSHGEFSLNYKHGINSLFYCFTLKDIPELTFTPYGERMMIIPYVYDVKDLYQRIEQLKGINP